MTRNPPRILMLDIGMVLVNLNFQPLADRMRELTGVSPARLREVLGEQTLIRNYETGRITDAAFHEEICRRLDSRISWADFLEAWYSIFGQPIIPDAILASLARIVPMWTLSNTNRLHFDFMQRHFAFLGHFEGFVLSHEVGAMKPDDRIFLAALEKTRTRPEEVLFVDDQEVNVQAALSLGIDAFQFRGLDDFVPELMSRGLRLPD
jgi:FMN phosphatase YigB (HAD superfamily)